MCAHSGMHPAIPARLFELLLKVMPALAPPGRTLSFAATDRNRLKGTSQVVMNRKPNMYSRECHESRQKYTPQSALLNMKKPAARRFDYAAAADACSCRTATCLHAVNELQITIKD